MAGAALSTLGYQQAGNHAMAPLARSGDKGTVQKTSAARAKLPHTVSDTGSESTLMLAESSLPGVRGFRKSSSQVLPDGLLRDA